MYRDPHDGSYGLDLRDPALLERARGQAVEHARRVNPLPVTARVRMVSQPAGGLLPPSLFVRVRLDDRSGLHAASRETVPPDIAGLFVDYMTRVVTGADVRIAFRVPLLGARLVGASERAESPGWTVSPCGPCVPRACCSTMIRPAVAVPRIGWPAARYRTMRPGRT